MYCTINSIHKKYIYYTVSILPLFLGSFWEELKSPSELISFSVTSVATVAWHSKTSKLLLFLGFEGMELKEVSVSQWGVFTKTGLSLSLFWAFKKSEENFSSQSFSLRPRESRSGSLLRAGNRRVGPSDSGLKFNDRREVSPLVRGSFKANFLSTLRWGDWMITEFGLTASEEAEMCSCKSLVLDDLEGLALQFSMLLQLLVLLFSKWYWSSRVDVWNAMYGYH